MTHVRCPSCQTVLAVTPELAGQVCRCSKCGTPLRMPAAQAPPAPAAPQLTPSAPPAPVAPAPVQRFGADDEKVLDELGRDDRLRRPQLFFGATNLPDLRDLPRDPLPGDCPEEVQALGKVLAWTLFDRGRPDPLAYAGIGAGALMMLGSAGFGLMAVFNILANWQTALPRLRETWLPTLGLFCGLLVAFLLGPVLSFLCYRWIKSAKRKEGWCCDGGVAWLHGDQWHWFRWEQAERLHFSVTHVLPSNLVGYTLKIGPEGKELSFHSAGTEGIAFGALLQREASLAMLPIFYRKLRAGEPVAGGPLTLHPDRFVIDDQVLPLPARELSLDKGFVVVPGRPIDKPIFVGDCSHLLLLLVLAEHLGRR